jgi:heme-degrading monooxygenase HmoA
MDKEYVVIFKTKRSLPMPNEYVELNKKLAELVKGQPGFKRIESVADSDGNGISVSYWDSMESIRSWKKNTVHAEAQNKGKSIWYQDYSVEICEMVRRYSKATES